MILHSICKLMEKIILYLLIIISNILFSKYSKLFVVFETNLSKFYWFEYSWDMERGIWGPFRNKDRLLEEIKNRGKFNFINPKIDILKLFKKDLITCNDMIRVGRGK